MLLTSTHPTSISYTRIPNAHQSTSRPCPLPCIISGAKYSGVPHNVYVRLKMTTQYDYETKVKVHKNDFIATNLINYIRNNAWIFVNLSVDN